MILLAIETTGPYASVAIYRDGVVREIINKTDYSHLQQITPMALEILKQCGIAPAELDAVVVSRGPGSFTGLRIGMATAKGLAQIWDKPIVCVPTLESFAYSEDPRPENALVCPVFDARRSQVYAAAFLGGETVVPEGAYAVEEYLDALRKAQNGTMAAIFYGDGVSVYKDAITGGFEPVLFAPEEFALQRAGNVARLAAKLYAKGELSDCYSAEPEYLRQAEAERKLKANGGL